MSERWQAAKGVWFYYVSTYGHVLSMLGGTTNAEALWHRGNLWKEHDQAQAYADARRALAMELHEADTEEEA